MLLQTRHTPAFGVVRAVLAAGEAVQAATESRVASSYGVSESSPQRGKDTRAVFTAPEQGGWVDLAPSKPGDVYPLELHGGTGYCVARGIVLARPPRARPDRAWPALRSMFGGDDGFLEHYGTGPLVLATDGPVDSLSLQDGEIVTVNPAFLVAYPDSVRCRLRASDPARSQSVRTGEGLAVDFAGPGSVLIQARPRG